VSNQGRSLVKVQYAQASSSALGVSSSGAVEPSLSGRPSWLTCTQRIPCAEQTSTHVIPSAAANQRDRPGAINVSHIKAASKPIRQRVALVMYGSLDLQRMIKKR
jgi:hypothetical protein